MSNLVVSNISDGTTSVGTGYVVNGAAKAWVNFNGTGTVAIRDSLNVGSITDNGTGDYTVNFSSNMGNTNYAIPAQVGNTASGRYGGLNDSDSRAAGSANFFCFQTSTGSALDPDEYSISVLGSLA
jgi:hypothetical protein